MIWKFLMKIYSLKIFPFENLFMEFFPWRFILEIFPLDFWKFFKKICSWRFFLWNMVLKIFLFEDLFMKIFPWRFILEIMLGFVPLNPIVWCYVCYYVWLNVVINKVSLLLLSKIMVTWISGHYHIVHEMHSMWFMWFSHRRYRSQVLCKLIILVCSQWWNWAFHLRRL